MSLFQLRLGRVHDVGVLCGEAHTHTAIHNSKMAHRRHADSPKEHACPHMHAPKRSKFTEPRGMSDNLRTAYEQLNHNHNDDHIIVA